MRREGEREEGWLRREEDGGLRREGEREEGWLRREEDGGLRREGGRGARFEVGEFEEGRRKRWESLRREGGGGGGRRGNTCRNREQE